MEEYPSLPTGTSDEEIIVEEIVPRLIRLMLSFTQSKGVRANNLDQELEGPDNSDANSK